MTTIGRPRKSAPLRDRYPEERAYRKNARQPQIHNELEISTPQIYKT
jgi:hypothetical protein